MEEHHIQLPSGQPVTEAYIHKSDPKLLELFGYHWKEERDWKARALWLEESEASRAQRAEVAQALYSYNAAHGASASALRHIEQLKDGALAVIGGQQAGLWSGPLMVLHKAVTIIQSAASARQRLGQPVVPIFWIAGEDHDWEEANHAYLVTSEPKLRKLELQRPKGARTSVSRSLLRPGQWQQALAELAAVLPDSPHKPELLDRLHGLTADAATLTDMFASMLAWLFGSHGLIVMDADDPAIRRLESPMFEQMIRSNESLYDAYGAAQQRLLELGYPIQAEQADNSANLFHFAPAAGASAAGDRLLLQRSGDRFEDRKRQVSYTREELLMLAKQEPELLSNNVLTRPLMQDYLFPVLATVLGPGEIAYWAATGSAFKQLGMEMPIVVPRRSFTLIDAGTAKHMEKYKLSVHTVLDHYEQYRNEWLDRQEGLQPMDQPLEQMQRELERMYEPVLAKLAGYGADMVALGETNRRKVMEQLEYLKGRLHLERSRRHEEQLRQMDRVQLQLCPLGKPQERVLNVVQLWNQWGLHWLEQLLQLPYDEDCSHRIVYI